MITIGAMGADAVGAEKAESNVEKLCEACKSGDRESVNELLDKGVDPNSLASRSFGIWMHFIIMTGQNLK